MGYANCGEDSQGRPIGYAHSATCDHPECDKKIDRGLSYACGGMHGEDDNRGGSGRSCEKYFCSEHLECVTVFDSESVDQRKVVAMEVCAACRKQAPVCESCEDHSWTVDPDDPFASWCADCDEVMEDSLVVRP